MRNYILFGVLFFLFGACSTHTTEFYEGNRYLYFDNEKGADTAFVSFSNYPGALSHEVAFRVFLTGELTETDLEYRLETVDSLTTAAVSDYKLPERLIFRKGMTVDTLVVTVKNENPVLAERSLSLVFRVVANENFMPGLAGRQEVKITFNNKKSKPEWWKGDLQTLILGTYSPKKMEHFIIATGVNSLEGVELSVARAYALQFKRYCVSNGLTEEDGVTPMVDGIPCY